MRWFTARDAQAGWALTQVRRPVADAARAGRVWSRVEALAGRYDVLLCDVWGVIHNGRESFPAACAALARFRAEVGPVILISNAPRPHPPIVEQLDSLNVPRAAWTKLVTSGDATRALLAERAPGPVWAIWPALPPSWTMWPTWAQTAFGCRPFSRVR